MKAPCKRTQGIVGQQLPTLLEVTCCVGLHTLLHVVVCCWAVGTVQTFSLIQTDATLLAGTSQYCCQLLRLFARSSKYAKAR